MKKIAFYLLTGICILMSSCGKSESQFDEELRAAYAEMGNTAVSSAITCSKISTVWRDAIFDNKKPHGGYCDDFNDALQELFEDFRKEGITDSINTWNNRMQEMTSKLNEHPESRNDCYNDFVEIVSEVSSFSRMATAPSGNLSTYNQQTNLAYENINKKLDQFKIKYGELLKTE